MDMGEKPEWAKHIDAIDVEEITLRGKLVKAKATETINYYRWGVRPKDEVRYSPPNMSPGIGFLGCRITKDDYISFYIINALDEDVIQEDFTIVYAWINIAK
jgi:hypothetical protein